MKVAFEGENGEIREETYGTDELLKIIKKELEDGLAYTYEEEYEGQFNNNLFPTKPEGDFKYMVEYFSGGVCPFDDERYEGWFEKNDYSGDYIRDAMKDILTTESLAKDIQKKYEKQGIKVVFLDFNKGCEWGCAINVWIPEQR